MLSNHYSCQILIKFEFSLQVFEKYSIKFHENPPSGSWIVPCGQTDRHEANSCSLQFYERLKKNEAY